ncbi:MAG: hypothetical protein KAI57_01590 [Candidatus Pacebacteria bacterium]|nr:hypothetical protein [Candidatus Paceibacterota bacterium]
MSETYHLNIFKCKLCEEVIFAEHKSSTCPFCGAHDNYIILAKDWEQTNNSDIFSKNERNNLEKALELERRSVRFYKCSISHTNNAKLHAIFKGLLRIKTEHILLLSKILKIQKANTDIQNICFRLDYENIETAIKNEKESEKFYIDSYNKATEKRIKEIFLELAEIEKDHIKLFEDDF